MVTRLRFMCLHRMMVSLVAYQLKMDGNGCGTQEGGVRGVVKLGNACLNLIGDWEWVVKCRDIAKA